MKKILLYFFLLFILFFALPIVFTNKFETKEVLSKDIVEDNLVNYSNNNMEMKKEKINENDDDNNYDVNIDKKIYLLHTETNEVEELNLESYLYGVVSAEMPANYEIEALKAQAVVARTYTLFKIKNGSKHENADICDNSLCCQAWISKENRFARWEEDKKDEYWNKIVSAVNSTKGECVKYNGELINAFFHSNSGGKTEIPINVWGGDYPYLQSVETSGEDAYSSYNSEIEISKDELSKKMLEKYSDFEIKYEAEDAIKILEYTESGRIKQIKIGNKVISGIEARSLFGLKSAKFNVEIIGDIIKFSVIGYGHGVGLSQSGSDVLAKSGLSYIDIIKYYYKDVEISE